MDKTRLMKLEEFDGSIWYRIGCACGDEQCDLTLELESDNNCVTLNMYKILRASAHWGYTDKWGIFDFIRVFFNKIRMCWKIMFSGYLEVNEAFLITDLARINEFILALEDGKEYLLHLPDMKETLQFIEEELVLTYEEDDSHVVDMIVNKIRTKIGNPRFAKGATFSDDERVKK